MHGRSLESERDNEEDSKVRDIFTQMISDFARHGKLNLDGQDVKPFSSSDNNFVQVTSKPKVAKGFRYCEMALWLGLAQRLQSTTCELFKVLDSQLKNIDSQLKNIDSQLKNVDLGSGTKKIEEKLTDIVKPSVSLVGNKTSRPSTGLLNRDRKVLPSLGIGRG